MTEVQSLTRFYKGWDLIQQQLLTVIAPLGPEQLALRASPHHWSIGMIATHIVSTRVGWFHMVLKEGDSADLEPLTTWEVDDQPPHTAAEITAGLEKTWRMIENALARWTPDDLDKEFHGWPYGDDDPWYSRQWVLWHVLEHDLMHGGELSLALGMHGLTSIKI